MNAGATTSAFRPQPSAFPLWQPRFPWAQVSQAKQDKAAKLRAVLEPFLRGLPLETRTQSEIEAAGIAAYQREFGHAISGRHFRGLYSRTLDRDAGRADWMRLEIYLDNNVSAAIPIPPADRPAHALHETALGDTIRTLDDSATPSPDDKKFLFDAAFRHLESQQGATSAFGRTLIDFLFNAVPALAPNRAALERAFYRKLQAWKSAGGQAEAIEDRRRLASGNFRKPDFAADEKKIRDSAILHGGNVSLAHRKLRQAGELSAAFVNYYKFDPRHNKSRVPNTTRETIAPEVEMCGPIHRGPWQAKMRGPYIPRDWSDIAPGDWFSGDDVTWNNYFYFYDEEGRLHIERGECLVFHDLRTGYILDYLLIAGKYNSRHIRKLMLAVHDRHGLPHAGFYFERGVWKARIISDIAVRESLHWRETESGVAGYNLQVKHATTPRAKPIEGLFHIIQERQRNEPGFVGFNERTLDMERMQDFLARARRGKVDPSDKLLSMDQWKKSLDTILAGFNNDPQNGKMLPGQRPSEAWQAGLDKKPLRKLPENARHYLSTHCKKMTVRQEGLVLNVGKNRLLFCNEETGKLIGREVLAHYSLECPQLLTVSDLNRQNYFTVKAISLPALSATKEQFREVHTIISGHTKAAREIYGGIEHPRIANVTRDTQATEETAALGEFHNDRVARFKQEQAAETSLLREIQLAAPGRVIPANVPPARFLQGIQLENAGRETQAAAQYAAPEIPAPSDSGGKECLLKTAPAPTPSGKQYFALWAQLEKAKPGLSRHALTQKHLGGQPHVKDMTPAQLAKMISVFSVILRDATKVTA